MRNSSGHASRNSIVRNAFVLNSDDLGRRVAAGTGYKFLGIVIRTIITIGSTATLARLLPPADFGYLAMASVIIEFAGLFGALGFTNVLIQRRLIGRLHLDTVFWATLALGIFLAAMVVVLSFFASWLFADPLVAPLLRVLSLSFILNSLTAVPWVVLSRLLLFRTEFWVQVGSAVTGTVAAVSCAYAGLGVWSLVIGGLVRALTDVLVNFACVPYFPRLRFYLPLLTSTWRTSGSYLGGNLLYYVYMNIDLVLIGRYLGAAPLGYYQNARSLTDEIRARIAMPIQHVLFPAFSAVQSESERIQKLVLRAGTLLAAVVIPVGFGVSANAAELVLVLYGEQWRPMIPVMSMFGLSAAIRASTAIAAPIFNASNRVGLGFLYNVVGTALMVVGVTFAIPYGIDVIATTIAVISLYSIVTFRAGLALIGMNLRHMAQILGPPTVASSIMWLATVGVSQVSATWSTHPGLLLPLHVVVGATIYLATLHLISRQYLQEFKLAIAAIFNRD